MNFLRQNVFYLAMAGAVVVCLVLLALIRSGPAGDIEKALEDRTATNNALNSVSRKPVNAKMVEHRKQVVQAARDKVAQVRGDVVAWNARNYRVLVHQLRGQPIAAFPANRVLFEAESLMPPFTREYVAAYESLVDSLRWVKPADETADVKPLADKLAEEMKVQAVAAGTTPEITAAGEKQFQPQDIARAKVLQERVRANWMYLTNDALDKSFTKEEVGATISALWAAQVNLWASQDIFAAIRQTNESVLKGLKEEDQNVLNAPVKRLVSVKIGAAHVTGGSIANEVYFTAREGPAAPAGGGFAPVGTQRRTVIETGSGSELTERACSTKYDVVHYRFAVVMPTRYVEALLINLMRQGNHTVEKVEMAEPKTAEAGTTLFYYGPEPVLEVTVFGELLLLTAWERGTADPQKPGEWLQAYPPLMPEEVLKGLQELSPSALRPEDNQRIELFRSGQPPKAGPGAAKG